MKDPAIYKVIRFFVFCYTLQSISRDGNSVTALSVDDDERIPLRVLTDAELAKLDELGMPVSQAAWTFNRKLAQAKALFSERNPTESPVQGDASPLNHTQKNRLEAPPMQFDTEDNASNLFEKILETTLPECAIQLCVQLELDLWYLLPGLKVSFGLLGALSLSLENGCWAFQFTVSVGIGWGFKVLGFSLGVGVVFEGTVDLIEVPIANAASEEGSALDTSFGDVYAPDGSNLEKCHTVNPWMVVQTWIEEQCRRALNKDSVHERSKELQQKADEVERKAIQMYQDILRTPFDLLEGGESLRWPALTLPAISLFQALASFLRKLPAYADQIMPQLVDNTKGNIFGIKTAPVYRYEEALGRFWARWPSSEDLKEWLSHCLEGETAEDEEDEDECLGREPLVGVDVTEKGNDQRVHNFAKVVRKSRHNNKFEFWKEIAISASNLFIRVIGDVVALFNVVFAGTPRWDGNCNSLQPSLSVEDRSTEVWDSHPWVSKYRSKSKRRSFASRTEDSSGRAYSRASLAIPEWLITGTEQTHTTPIYPRLWCVLADQTPMKSRLAPNEAHQDIEERAEDIELFVPPACETVTLRIRELNAESRIQWDGIQRVYTVFGPDSADGILVNTNLTAVPQGALEISDAAPGDALKLALEREYQVATKNVDSRLECEKVLIPGPFVRIFNKFVKYVQEQRSYIEENLDRINDCLSEKIWNVHKRSQTGHSQCETSLRKLLYVKDYALATLRIVRLTVIALGAEDPRVAVPQFQEGDFEFSEKERQAIAGAQTVFAPMVQHLANDFIHGFDLKVNDELEMDVDSCLLIGDFWLQAPKLVDSLLTIPDPSSRVAKISSLWLRPPVRFGYSFEVQLASATPTDGSFCTPNTALLLITPLQASYLRKTWSRDFEAKEMCWGARVRVGDFFILVRRCQGADPGGHYVDWRIKFLGVIVKGNVLGSDRSGLLGNLLTPGTSQLGPARAGVITTGVLLGGLASHILIDSFKPHVHKHPVLTALVLLSTSFGPLLGAAAGAATMSEPIFKDVCETVLRYLSEHGVVGAPSDGEASSPSPVTIDMALVLWSAIVFTEKHVEIKTVPPGYTPGMKTQIVSTIAAKGESWNRFDLAMQIPSAGKFSFHAELDIRLSLTSFVVYGINAERWKKNQKRVAACFCCLLARHGFCDWKIALGSSLWDRRLDTCVHHSAEEVRRCTGAKTEQEHESSSASDGRYWLPGSGIYFSPENGPEICAHMDFVRSNNDPVANEMRRMFLSKFHERNGTSSQEAAGAPWVDWSAKLPHASVCKTDFLTMGTARFVGIATAIAGSIVCFFVVSAKLWFKRRRRLKEETRRTAWKIQDPAYPCQWGIELRDEMYASESDTSMVDHGDVYDTGSGSATCCQRLRRLFVVDVDASRNQSQVTRHTSAASVSHRSSAASDSSARSVTSHIQTTTSQVSSTRTNSIGNPSAPSQLHAPDFVRVPSQPGNFAQVFSEPRSLMWLPRKSRSLHAPRLQTQAPGGFLQAIPRNTGSPHATQLHHTQSSSSNEPGSPVPLHTRSVGEWNSFDRAPSEPGSPRLGSPRAHISPEPGSPTWLPQKSKSLHAPRLQTQAPGGLLQAIPRNTGSPRATQLHHTQSSSSNEPGSPVPLHTRPVGEWNRFDQQQFSSFGIGGQPQ